MDFNNNLIITYGYIVKSSGNTWRTITLPITYTSKYYVIAAIAEKQNNYGTAAYSLTLNTFTCYQDFAQAYITIGY